VRKRDLEWWLLALVAVAIVAVWPPEGGRSLAAKLVNWAVDPSGRLPVLPGVLPLGLGDDPAAVEEHDAEMRYYDELYDRGGWTRWRLRMKVAGDPFDPATTRQVLTVAAVLAALYAWRLGTRRGTVPPAAGEGAGHPRDPQG